jgi:hypothetical protein
MWIDFRNKNVFRNWIMKLKWTLYLFLKSIYCEYILEKILSTSEVGPIWSYHKIYSRLYNGVIKWYIILWGVFAFQLGKLLISRLVFFANTPPKHDISVQYIYLTVVVFRFVMSDSGWSIPNEFGGLRHARVSKLNPLHRNTSGIQIWYITLPYV